MIPAPKGVMTSTRSNRAPGRMPNGSVGPEKDTKIAKYLIKPVENLDFWSKRDPLRPHGPAGGFFWLNVFFG